LVQTPAKGIPYLETAVTLSRDRPSAPRLKLAEVLLELGRHAEAEVHCQRVLEIEADEPRAHLGLARIALAREQWSQAEEHLRHCTSSPFARQRALSLLATALRRMPGREHDAAVAAAQAQLPPPDLDFDSFDPFADEADPVGVGKNHGLAAAMTLNMKGRRREAAMVLRALAREYPDDSWILVKLIEFQLRDGDVAGAAAVARDTTQQDPQSAQAHFYLGVALFHLATDRPQKPASPEIESLDPAVQHLRRAVQLKPDHGYAFNYLGQALSKTRRSSEAYQAFVDAARCYPGFADPHLHSANLWLDLGCAPLAAFHLHQATRLTARDDPRVQQILARICFIRSLHGFP
jgi:Flp pilus assembly protein TadD